MKKKFSKEDYLETVENLFSKRYFTNLDVKNKMRGNGFYVTQDMCHEAATALVEEEILKVLDDNGTYRTYQMIDENDSMSPSYSNVLLGDLGFDDDDDDDDYDDDDDDDYDDDDDDDDDDESFPKPSKFLKNIVSPKLRTQFDEIWDTVKKAEGVNVSKRYFYEHAKNSSKYQGDRQEIYIEMQSTDHLGVAYWKSYFLNLLGAKFNDFDFSFRETDEWFVIICTTS